MCFYAVQDNTKNIEKENQYLKAQLEKLQFERDEFKRQLDELKRMIFGKKSERFVHVDKAQLELFEQQPAEQEEESEKQTNRIPEHKANKLEELLPQNWKPLK